MGIVAFVSQGAASKIVSLADLLSTLCVSFSLVRGGDCWTESRYDGGSVAKGSAPLGDCPNVNVLLDNIPADGGVSRRCLAE